LHGVLEGKTKRTCPIRDGIPQIRHGTNLELPIAQNQQETGQGWTLQIPATQSHHCSRGDREDPTTHQALRLYKHTFREMDEICSCQARITVGVIFQQQQVTFHTYVLAMERSSMPANPN
jgi:hypothetical protein